MSATTRPPWRRALVGAVRVQHAPSQQNRPSVDCVYSRSIMVELGQTWFSCSLYSFHSEQAEQESSPLHLCWRTPEYSVLRGCADRTVTWPVPKRWRIIACMRGNILYRLIYSGVLQSAQFYLFMWLFWRTPSTLKIAKSSPSQLLYNNSPNTVF